MEFQPCWRCTVWLWWRFVVVFAFHCGCSWVSLAKQPCCPEELWLKNDFKIWYSVRCCHLSSYCLVSSNWHCFYWCAPFSCVAHEAGTSEKNRLANHHHHTIGQTGDLWLCDMQCAQTADLLMRCSICLATAYLPVTLAWTVSRDVHQPCLLWNTFGRNFKQNRLAKVMISDRVICNVYSLLCLSVTVRCCLVTSSLKCFYRCAPSPETYMWPEL